MLSVHEGSSLGKQCVTDGSIVGPQSKVTVHASISMCPYTLNPFRPGDITNGGK